MEQGSLSGGALRILHVVGGMRPGGVENWILRVLRSVDRGHHAMDFVVHSEIPCEYDSEIRRLGGRLFRCPRTRQPWRYARDLIRILRVHGPFDVIHSHVFLYSGVVLAIARLAGVPVRLAHFHTPLEAGATGLARSVYRTSMLGLIDRCATAILANSHSTLSTLGPAAAREGADDRVIYPLTRDVPPRLEREAQRRIRQRHGLPADGPLVIYLARFAPLKNHAQMVRIADWFRDRSERVHFVMAGSHGAMLERFREAARQRANLTLLSEFEDPMALLSCADLFFFPSLKEGFGIVAHEAATWGLPVVASDLPGLREAVAPACHEFLFPPDDDTAAALSLTRLLSNEALRAAASEASRAWAESMSPRNSIRKLLAVYDAARGISSSALASRKKASAYESKACDLGCHRMPSPAGRKT